LKTANVEAVNSVMCFLDLFEKDVEYYYPDVIYNSY